MRVFLGVAEVAGYYRGLKSGFDELGVACTFIDLSAHPFRYGGADESALVRAIRRMRAQPGWVSRWSSYLLRLLLFLAVAPRHDVFIFSFGTSLLPRNLDLRLLRVLGKRVICQFHGSDSRPPYLDGTVVQDVEPESIRRVIELAARKKKSLRTIDRYADVIVDTPPQGFFHERSFVVWLRLGLPNRPARIPPPPEGTPSPEEPGRTLRILHSPSRPVAKGTARIREAVSALRARGLPIELVEMQGRPNVEVLEELERADFVVDQLYADYGMPGFATEAAWFGKAVVICGYAKELWDSLLPPESIPPTHYCRPDQLEHAIERMVRDPRYRRDLGRRAREFVETRWSPRHIAAEYLRLASGGIPDDWLWNPAETRYWQGACLSEDRVRAILRSVIEAGGVRALQVSDKPELEWLLVSEAGMPHLLRTGEQVR